MMNHNASGFTLVEMLLVLAIIAIIMTLAIPDQTPRTTKAQIEEIIKYSDAIKPAINAYYTSHNHFPANNSEAGLNASDKLISTLIKETRIEDGAIHFLMGNNAADVLKNKTLTLQPLIVTGSNSSPIDWSCGYSRVPEGMEAKGKNKTDIKASYLPIKCLYLEQKK